MIIDATFEEQGELEADFGVVKRIGGGADIIVDDELSTTSENPVQNKVITETINRFHDEFDAHKYQYEGIVNGFDKVLESHAERLERMEKNIQDKLTFPKFEKIGGAEEYNEITKAVEVSTFEELKAYDGTAILKNYRHESVAKGGVANTEYDILKIPVNAGDVVRDKLATWWKSTTNKSGWMYAFFYDANGSSVSSIIIYYDGHASVAANYLDIRENGITAPDNSTYVLINIWHAYELVGGGEPIYNNKTANVITKNKDASLTEYDGLAPLPDYVPVSGVDGDVYYQTTDDVRIPRYDDALGSIGDMLGDIEAILADVVGGVE